ncbi:GNAT family N-acetyltransferase [Streptomyces aidingensis]|uniref:Acetyltransferase (GNAT) family protein n=1 Tax=Streptomyces aidingensis TaxID=910347 RepID=A0A1I1FB00_9ACTN|nr:GNAT family N-acetyltransferase [Streptomyces aidingensis]SFB96659.1 Acetyltransferase (GNAT) family protein [Streptomyces aidingensis]
MTPPSAPSEPSPPPAAPRPPVTVRPFRPGDREAMADICIRTGHIGGDARPHYRDPGVLPVLFALPYAEFDPGLVFVADNGERAIGYIVGTEDSTVHFRRLRDQWLPLFAGRYPQPELPAADPDSHLADLLHHAERMLPTELVGDYPAHLHIDLLPEGQGRGLGRKLMETYLDALRARRVPGVHLGMSPENTRARGFYDRLGFRELRAPGPGEPTLYLGMRLA